MVAGRGGRGSLQWASASSIT